MRQTNEQRKGTAYLRAIAGGYRVELDAEGWPIVPGRLGRIEYHDDTHVVVFTNCRRLHARLLAIPSIQRHQTGDEELRAAVSISLDISTPSPSRGWGNFNTAGGEFCITADTDAAHGSGLFLF